MNRGGTPKVYARKLRDMGFDIDAGIPDCAWIPLYDFVESLSWSTEMDGDTLKVLATCSPRQPFRWVDAAFTITKENKDDD